MKSLLNLLNKNEKLIVGLMSGTSMDGIDAALVRTRGSGKNTTIELINFRTFSYPAQLRDRLLEISQPGQGSVNSICQLNFVIGEYFAKAVLDLCRVSNIDVTSIDLIGSHGQTIHHLPGLTGLFGVKTGSTLQIGEPAVIANRVGCVTVANFRSADIALRGQGAPLVPYFDYLMFNSEKYNRVVLNIGGIANMTMLKKGGKSNEILAFDTGPGNMVINALMKIFYNSDYDNNGSVALRGHVAEELLARMLRHSYFSRPVPKSTGREEFGNSFVAQILAANTELKLSNEDIIATATELTGRTIAQSLKFAEISIEEVDQLIISGGGIHNQALIRSLSNYFEKSEIVTTDDFNIPGDAKEAICFAVLANETIAGNPANLPSVTGAERATILGSIYFT